MHVANMNSAPRGVGGPSKTLFSQVGSLDPFFGSSDFFLFVVRCWTTFGRSVFYWHTDTDRFHKPSFDQPVLRICICNIHQQHESCSNTLACYNQVFVLSPPIEGSLLLRASSQTCVTCIYIYIYVYIHI